MATATGKDRSGITKANKEKYQAKVTKRLAKRKAWRMKKYGDYPTEELFRSSLSLFVKWGHRKDDCVRTLKAKRFLKPRKKVFHDQAV